MVHLPHLLMPTLCNINLIAEIIHSAQNNLRLTDCIVELYKSLGFIVLLLAPTGLHKWTAHTNTANRCNIGHSRFCLAHWCLQFIFIGWIWTTNESQQILSTQPFRQILCRLPWARAPDLLHQTDTVCQHSSSCTIPFYHHLPA